MEHLLPTSSMVCISKARNSFPLGGKITLQRSIITHRLKPEFAVLVLRLLLPS